MLPPLSTLLNQLDTAMRNARKPANGSHAIGVQVAAKAPTGDVLSVDRITLREGMCLATVTFKSPHEPDKWRPQVRQIVGEKLRHGLARP